MNPEPIQVVNYICGVCRHRHATIEAAEVCCECRWEGSDCHEVAQPKTGDWSGESRFCAKHARQRQLKRARDAVRGAKERLERIREQARECEEALQQEEAAYALLKGGA